VKRKPYQLEIPMEGEYYIKDTDILDRKLNFNALQKVKSGK
jgi:hypothetical protein